MKTIKFMGLLCVLMVSSFHSNCLADSRQLELDVQSLEKLAQQSGLIREISRRGPGPNKIVIAILDNGFYGRDQAIGRTLPATTVFHPGPVSVPVASEEAHGLKMAEIVTDHLRRAGIKFELHLYSAFGFSNLNHAVNAVIQQKPDLVLYPQVWEYGGNPDGSGFINQTVSRATANGIKWINAAGNFGQNFYQAPVERIADDWTYLPGPNSSVQFRCHKNVSGACQIRSVLSWSSFANDTKIGTEKDLDLVLTDDTLKVLQSAALVQKVPAGERPLAAGESLYPREILETTVKPGVYYLRVKVRSQNFTKADYLRITTSGDFIEQLNRTEGETLLAPADLPSVITVGASDSNLSASSRSKVKPEFRLNSTVEVLPEENSSTDANGVYKGSSNSSAAFTARAAFELSHNPRLTRQELVEVIRTGRLANAEPVQLSTKLLPPNGQNCFPAVVLRMTSPQIKLLLRSGLSWVVETSTGTVVMTDEDPFIRAQKLQLSIEKIDQPINEPILLAWVDGTSSGLRKLSESNRLRPEVPGSYVEFAKAPQNFKVCGQ